MMLLAIIVIILAVQVLGALVIRWTYGGKE
jgi:hypothetical protein